MHMSSECDGYDGVNFHIYFFRIFHTNFFPDLIAAYVSNE